MSVFKRFHPRLQHALVNRLQWRSLRDVQELAAAAILDQQNCIVLAPTAGGKTEAAFFPVISGLLTDQLPGVGCLYLSPLRALLNNQEERLGLYTDMVGLKRFKWHGEALAKDKQAFLKEPCELLMTTPESLEVMLISPHVKANTLFQNLRYVVIDEIHALAGVDRGAHLLAVLERLSQISQFDFQRIGLSATVGNVNGLLNWLQGSSKHPGQIIQPPQNPGKKQIEIKLVDEVELSNLVGQRAFGKKSLIFTDSRRRAESLGLSLARQNIDIFVHHSSISREEREQAEAKVTAGKNVAIVSTSTLELGIDVGELDLVFQAEAPATVASFLQRMGRTGRRPGSVTNTTFLSTNSESLLQAIALVELARSHWVESIKLDDSAWPILVHQTMACCLQHGSVTRHQVWQTLKAASCFSQITESAFYSLIDFLKSEDFLSEESGVLSMGLKAEETFGRRHFLELYSVFSSPTAYQVVSLSGQSLGAIEWPFADGVEMGSCFRLSGQGWLVKRINHNERTLWVEKSSGGVAPKWGGFAPMMLSYQLGRKIRDVLVSEQIYPYCDSKARQRLDDLRQERMFLRSHFAPLQISGPHTLWWTYAGGKINNTLRYALAHELGCEITSNNYSLRFPETVLNQQDFDALLQQMSLADYWHNSALLQAIQLQLPEQRLSKFQPCLPENLQHKMLAKEYLALSETQTFITDYLNSGTAD